MSADRFVEHESPWLHAAKPAAQVTLNMLNHADALGYNLDGEQYASIYRAMAAAAPKSPSLPLPPGTYVTSDCTIGDLMRMVASLTSERDALRQALDLVVAGPSAPTPLTAPDLPPPARRPDGTLAPQPKPFPMLKQASGSRRVGG